MGVRYFRTIDDMERFYYPEQQIADDLLKADAPILTTTAGVRNIIFGRKLWEAIVIEANTFGILEKKPWDKSGYRRITAAATTGRIGLGEGQAIPDTIKPTFEEVAIAPRRPALAYEMSDIELAVEGKDDTIFWADLTEYMQQEFLNSLNRDILTDNDTLAGSSFESIDRIIGSNSEISGVGQTTGDLDIYNIDRDSGTTADSAVDHNSGVDRTFNLTQLDNVLETARPFWINQASMDNKVWVTGFDTEERWQQLLQSQQRFVGEEFQITMNGLQTSKGAKGGFVLSSYRGAPIFADNNVPKDTISRVYLIDKDFLWAGILKPAQHIESEDYQALDKFSREAVEFIMGELVCVKFQAQGKLRDLK